MPGLRQFRRDSSVIMLVEKDVDLENIERTGNFRGKYFVFGRVAFFGRKRNSRCAVETAF